MAQTRSGHSLHREHPLYAYFPGNHVEENAELDVTVTFALRAFLT